MLDVQLGEPRTRRVRWSKQNQGSREGDIALVSEAAEGLRERWGRKRAGYDDHRAVDEELRSGAGAPARQDDSICTTIGICLLTSISRCPRFSGRSNLDPALADAAAEVAQLHSHRAEAGTPPGEVIPEVETWARRALAVDPRNGKAWAALTAAETHGSLTNARKMLDNGLRAATFGPRCAMCRRTTQHVDNRFLFARA